MALRFAMYNTHGCEKKAHLYVKSVLSTFSGTFGKRRTYGYFAMRNGALYGEFTCKPDGVVPFFGTLGSPCYVS